MISDEQWALMEPHCLGKKSDPGRRGSDARTFMEEECTREDNSGNHKDFWPAITEVLKEKFWSKLEGHLFEASTLLICCTGDLHNLCLEPSKPSKVHLMTRLPGLAFFAYSRGLFGATTENATPNDNGKVRVGIIADETAKDIPMAAIARIIHRHAQFG
ncbi:MAG: transposase [Rhodobacteraceae bacterium]|nr:transposase [Paracoccaceae bacterium]